MNSEKRILKEILNIEKNPIENIIIALSDIGIYDIFFLMKFDEFPYNNLYLFGKLKLPTKYPYSASDFYVYTKNGRFETDKKICTNSSSYHQESFSATYNIRNLLISLYSFVYEESTGIGSLNMCNENRQNYSNESLKSNKKIDRFNELFSNRLSEFTLKKNQNIEIDDKTICRICLENDVLNNLIAPCECKGTQKYVHKKCLEESQINYILNQSTNPQYQSNIDTHCSICKTEYKFKTKSRDELFYEYSKSISDKLKSGMLLISSKESSNYNKKIIELNKNNLELVKNIEYWTNSIILITESINHYLGVILTLPIKNSKNFDNYINHYNINLNFYKKINIYLGGPCNTNIIYAVVLLDNFYEFLNKYNIDIQYFKIIETNENTSLIFGEFVVINQIAEFYYKFNINKINLYVFEGISGWSKSQNINSGQLSAEICKGSWCITKSNLKKFPYKDMWNELENKGIKCPKNPYTKNYQENEL